MRQARIPVVLMAAVLGLVPAAAVPQDGAPDGLRPRDLKRHVKRLAADRLAGRETGGPGIDAAERYVAREFQRIGLAPVPGHDDHFIDVTLYRRSFDPGRTTLDVAAGERRSSGVAGEDFRPFPFSGEGRVDAEVVFAGYGITSDEHDWDDYAGLDVEGKVVLVLRHEPGERDPHSSFDGTEPTAHASFATKARLAREHGAAGMILVTDPLHHDTGDDLRIGRSLRLEPPRERGAEDAGGDPEQEPEPAELLAVHVAPRLAELLISRSGSTLAGLQRAVDAGTPPAERPLGGARATLVVARAEQAQPVSARNVAGFLEGSDPGLRDQWIVIGGHHDHVGAHAGRGDTVYNGADDNASGTAGVLELARAFAGRAEPPRRSLLFVTFTAEEKGLLGSRALVEQELIPVDRVAFMLNLDMIGRNPDRPVDVFGDGYVRGLRALVEEANAAEELALRFGGSRYAGNSDHDPFHDAAVPFMFFFTGIHDDYHRPGDHPGKLDYRRMAGILRVAYRVVDRLAAADEAPRFIHNVAWLGLRVVVDGEGAGDRARVVETERDSPAAATGLEPGDELVAFDGQPLARADEVGRRFDAVEPGSSVELAVTREGRPLSFTVERAMPGYLGVFPGEVDDEARERHGLAADEGLLLRDVVPGGPAERAGLQKGDVVVRLDGRPLSAASLGSRLLRVGAGETVELELIRDGRRLTLPVTLDERP